MGKNEPEAKQWFAIRVTYSREMALKEYLDRCRMESFIPMSYKEIIKGERKVRKLVPVIHNLVCFRFQFAAIIIQVINQSTLGKS